ncbi:hypothetical protein CR513_50062, partial [Mucuna pruriens]
MDLGLSRMLTINQKMQKMPEAYTKLFISGRFMNQVEETFKDQEGDEKNDFVCPCDPQKDVENLATIKLPRILVFNSNEESVKEVKIDMSVKETTKGKLTHLLVEYIDVFARTY